MISYYLLSTIVDALTAVNEDDWQIAADIKDGRISQILVKPINYLHYRLCLFVSGRVIYTLAALIPVGVFIFLERAYLLPPAGTVALLCFILSLILTALLQFLISYLTALLAFWVLEISSFVFIALAFERIATGQMFPLDILPAGLAKALMFTPFPYQMFLPVSIYMGKLTGWAMAQALVIQAAWVAVCYLLARVVWTRGLRTYGAVGG
jgi:ABC-2 type transport system permease protein